jgi:ASPIC and UnbV./FG-GAP repeat.
MGGSGARPLPKPKPSGIPWPVSFTDVAASAGLQFRFTSGNPARKKYIIEANGSGVAFVDFNNDTLLDIFLVNGSRLEGFPAGKAPTNRLYRNEGGGRFRDVTEESGVGYAGWGNGVCAGDFDNDGYPDLYVTYFGRNLLHRNKGDGTFAEVAEKAGVAGTGREWSTGCTFIDYDRDGRLDLFVTRYVGFNIEKAPLPGASSFCLWKGSPVFCGPRGLPYGSVALYRNRGDGAFEDVTVSAGLDSVRGCYAFTAVAADFSGDGWTDIYVACDSTPSVYLRNEKNGKFKDIGTESGLAFNEDGAEQAGMGIGVGDFDNDGLLDITKTNFTGEYPNLYRGLGKNVFTDVAVRAGLAVNPNHVLWGTAFVDLDNNGWKDLLQVSGHVYPEVGQIDSRELFTAQRLVYRNLGGGKFEDVSGQSGTGILAKFSSRGAAFGDFDNDGDIDVLVMNMHEAPSLLRNDLKSSNHWVKLSLQGTKSNRSAIGATVTIETAAGKQTDAVLSQSSFLSQNDFRLHFGLGAEAEVKRITVRWPSGDVEEFPGVSAGAMYLLVEGTGKARPVELKR